MSQTLENNALLPGRNEDISLQPQVLPRPVRLDLNLESSDLARLGMWLEDLIGTAIEDRFSSVATPTLARFSEPESLISVEELARRIHQSNGATRRLLTIGEIPGARRKDPSKANSHWLIPDTSAAAYLGTFYGGR